MYAYIDKKPRFTEYEDTIGILLSDYVYAIINGELLDIRHFMC